MIEPCRAVVLFDLDGTLSDSAGGILAALRHAFAVNGLPELDPAVEQTLLGPPFHESLPGHIGDVPLADITAAYREYYLGGAMFDTSVYPGVESILTGLRGRGVPLAVATSKPEFYAVPIVERLGLADYFTVIGGDVADGSGTKADVIGRVLARLGDPEPAAALMVGDRSHDVIGARVHGVPCAGAGWGYGPAGELAAAGADPICATPAELGAFLGLAEA